MDTGYFIYENKGLDFITDILNVAIGIFVVVLLLKLIISGVSYIYRVSRGILSDLFARENSSKRPIDKSRVDRKAVFKDDLENVIEDNVIRDSVVKDNNNINFNIKEKEPTFKKKE